MKGLMGDLGERYPGEWRPVVGWETAYLISDLGDVWSLPRNRAGRGSPGKNGLLKHSLDKDGYHEVCLSANGHKKRRSIHKLVAEAFLGPCPPGQLVRHLNDDKDNNAAINLSYGTDSENKRDAVRNGRNANKRKTHCKRGYPLSGDNLWIEKTGARHCRQCTKDRHAAAL